MENQNTISPAILQKASDLVVKATNEIGLFEPALFQFFSLLDLKATANKKVNCRIVVNNSAKGVIEYNPNFIVGLKEKTIVEYILTCETLRFCLHHCTTRKLANMQAMTIASDVIVGTSSMAVLDRSKQEVKEFIKGCPNKEEYRPIFKSMGYDFDNDFNLETIYEIICKLNQDNDNNSNGSGDSDESHGEIGESGDSGDNSTNDKGNDTPSYFDKSASNTLTKSEGWGENDFLDNEMKEVTKRITTQNISHGNVGGNLWEKIVIANTPRIDWKRVLRNFKNSIIDKFTEETRARPNRRHGFDLPGQRHLFRSRVLVAIDVSGSMSEDDINTGLSLITPLMKHCDISYACWDCNCSDFTKIRRPMKEFDSLGGGGTNPQCVLDKIAVTKSKFDGIIMFTDNGFDWQKPMRGSHKIMIIETPNACEAPSWVKNHVGLDLILKDKKQ